MHQSEAPPSTSNETQITFNNNNYVLDASNSTNNATSEPALNQNVIVPTNLTQLTPMNLSNLPQFPTTHP